MPYTYLEGADRFALDLEQIERRSRRAPAPHPERPAQPHRRRVHRRPSSSALAELASRHDLSCSATRPTSTCATTAPSRSLASLPGMQERCVILYTFSKKYAMTGWRLGAAIGPDAGSSTSCNTLNVNVRVVHQPVRAVGRRRGADRRPERRARDPGHARGPPRRGLGDPERHARRALPASRTPPSTCIPTSPAPWRAAGLTDYESFRRADPRATPACRCARACTSGRRCPARRSATCASPTPASPPHSIEEGLGLLKAFLEGAR